MSLDNLKKISRRVKSNIPIPTWVKDTNISRKAYNTINQSKIEKLQYISTHNLSIAYKRKKDYLIVASDIARKLGVAPTTLISTSSYSIELKNYIDQINQELLIAKDAKLKTHKKTLSGGTKQRKKDELRLELQKTKLILDKLQKQNAKEQVEYVLQELPLPLKRILGLNV